MTLTVCVCARDRHCPMQIFVYVHTCLPSNAFTCERKKEKSKILFSFLIHRCAFFSVELLVFKQREKHTFHSQYDSLLVIIWMKTCSYNNFPHVCLYVHISHIWSRFVYTRERARICKHTFFFAPHKEAAKHSQFYLNVHSDRLNFLKVVSGF